MNWDDLQIFLAVARAGQLQSAGRSLGRDRTTVGRRLLALERRLQVELFVRTREGLRLSPAGQLALAHAERMEREARAVVDQAAPPAEIAGTVRIAVTEALAPSLVERGVLELLERHPALRLELLAGNRRVDLAAGEADLAVRVDPIAGPQLKVRCLVRSAVALFASPRYLERHGRPASPRRLAGHALLLPGGELSHLPEGRWLAAQPGTRVALSSNSFPALVTAARAGAGVVALTGAWGEREEGLERLFDVPGLPPRALWLATTAAAARRPACRAVIDQLALAFRSRR